MDNKTLIKTAQERIISLSQEVNALRKENNNKDVLLKQAMDKVAYFEKEKEVDRLLDILIDEKHYIQEANRQEKRAMLMSGEIDLDSFKKTANMLDTRDIDAFYETSAGSSPDTKEDAFFDKLYNTLSTGLYGRR